MKALGKLFDGMIVVLILLNMLGGIAAGIWLALLGEWDAILRGIAVTILGVFAISLAVLPGLLFAVPAAAFASKRRRAGLYLFALLSMAYTYAVLITWCILVMLYFAARSDDSSAVPTMLLAYCAATVPIAFLAQKDLRAGNEHATVASFFSQVAFVVSVLVAFTLRPGLLAVILAFVTIMFIGLAIHASIAYAMDKGQRTYSDI